MKQAQSTKIERQADHVGEQNSESILLSTPSTSLESNKRLLRTTQNILSHTFLYVT